ncbi:MAG: putative aromatic acid transporter [Sphingomonas bacterium]|nr:putative aromatic acid transporter [Sphingomonas bacterium]
MSHVPDDRLSGAGDVPFGWRHGVAFGLLFLSLVSDGFDLQAVGFAAPGMVRDWGVTRAALGPALSAGLVGVLVGAPLLGWVGDRFGRKRAILLGSVFYGTFCLLCAGAGSIDQLIALRFLTGIGLGGVLPNVIALTAETAPSRVRPFLTALVTVGISLGGVTVGLVAAVIVPLEGWRALFVIGGVVPLVVAALVAIGLPESPAFLARKRGEALPPSPAEPREASGSIFAGQFKTITPIIWLLFAGLLMSIYLLTSWLPLVLENGGMSASGAAIMNTMLQFGGVIGGIGASLLIGRIGLPLIAMLVGGALVVVTFLAMVPVPDVALAAVLGLCGICVIGGQTAINASAGLIYPPAMRAKGVGFALGIGRLGSIIGPLVGGLVIGLGTGAQSLFLGPLLPLGIAFVASILLIRRCSITVARPATASTGTSEPASVLPAGKR